MMFCWSAILTFRCERESAHTKRLVVLLPILAVYTNHSLGGIYTLLTALRLDYGPVHLGSDRQSGFPPNDNRPLSASAFWRWGCVLHILSPDFGLGDSIDSQPTLDLWLAWWNVFLVQHHFLMPTFNNEEVPASVFADLARFTILRVVLVFEIYPKHPFGQVHRWFL